MSRYTFGAIDIGSNAIRLLIDYVEEYKKPEFKKAAFVRVPIRLGKKDVFSKRIYYPRKGGGFDAGYVRRLPHCFAHSLSMLTRPMRPVPCAKPPMVRKLPKQ